MKLKLSNTRFRPFTSPSSPMCIEAPRRGTRTHFHRPPLGVIFTTTITVFCFFFFIILFFSSTEPNRNLCIYYILYIIIILLLLLLNKYRDRRNSSARSKRPLGHYTRAVAGSRTRSSYKLSSGTREPAASSRVIGREETKLSSRTRGCRHVCVARSFPFLYLLGTKEAGAGAVARNQGTYNRNFV